MGSAPAGPIRSASLEIEVFRTSWWLRGSTMASSALWWSILVAAPLIGGLELRIYAGVMFFVLLFTWLAWAHHRTSIDALPEGLVFRGLLGPASVRFTDIVGIDVMPGLLGRHYVLKTRRGTLMFSSGVSGHERLHALIVERARLAA